MFVSLSSFLSINRKNNHFFWFLVSSNSWLRMGIPYLSVLHQLIFQWWVVGLWTLIYNTWLTLSFLPSLHLSILVSAAFFWSVQLFWSINLCVLIMFLKTFFLKSQRRSSTRWHRGPLFPPGVNLVRTDCHLNLHSFL